LKRDQHRGGHAACDLGPGKTIVTILADGGQRDQSKLFNPEFLRKKNLPLAPWMKRAR
jgi:cysteine synthase